MKKKKKWINAALNFHSTMIEHYCTSALFLICAFIILGFVFTWGNLLAIANFNSPTLIMLIVSTVINWFYIKFVHPLLRARAVLLTCCTRLRVSTSLLCRFILSFSVVGSPLTCFTKLVIVS